MSVAVDRLRSTILGRGVKSGCTVGAALGLIAAMGFCAVGAANSLLIVPVGVLIGTSTGAVMGFVGALTLRHYCVPGPVTFRRARLVAATSMCVLTAIVALALTADFSIRRHQPVVFTAVAGWSLGCALVTGAIAAVLAQRVVWGQAVARPRAGRGQGVASAARDE